jgi:hypothetical protein
MAINSSPLSLHLVILHSHPSKIFSRHQQPSLPPHVSFLLLPCSSKHLPGFPCAGGFLLHGRWPRSPHGAWLPGTQQHASAGPSHGCELLLPASGCSRGSSPPWRGRTTSLQASSSPLSSFYGAQSACTTEIHQFLCSPWPSSPHGLGSLVLLSRTRPLQPAARPLLHGQQEASAPLQLGFSSPMAEAELPWCRRPLFFHLWPVFSAQQAARSSNTVLCLASSSSFATLLPMTRSPRTLYPPQKQQAPSSPGFPPCRLHATRSMYCAATLSLLAARQRAALLFSPLAQQPRRLRALPAHCFVEPMDSTP